MDQNSLAVSVANLQKKYNLYDRQVDRLKELLNPFKKYHREFEALKNISFNIPKGKTVGIIGKNGSGKSTLLKVLAGVLTPTSGDLEIRGKVSALLELGAGFNPELTGLENIYLNGFLMGYSREQMHSRVNEICAFADIGDYIHQPVKLYSSGMFARLAFSVSISVEPDILIVDEALSVGDYMFQFKCMQKIKSLSDAGVTIFYVSHSTQSIIQNCNMAMFLADGEIVKISENVQSVVYTYEEYIRKTSRVSSSNSPLENRNEIRLGTHEARIDKIDFLQPETTETLWAGESADLRIKIDSSKTFANVVLGMSLRTLDGLNVWGDNSLNAISTTMSLSPGSQYYTFRFSPNITAGKYVLFIGLADISGSERVELDQRWGTKQITIMASKNQAEGFAYSPLQFVESSTTTGLAQ